MRKLLIMSFFLSLLLILTACQTPQLPKEEIEVAKQYICPESIDCSPKITSEGKPVKTPEICTDREYHKWAIENCPNVPEFLPG